MNVNIIVLSRDLWAVASHELEVPVAWYHKLQVEPTPDSLS